MGRLSPKKAKEDGATPHTECVFCGLPFTEVATLHRHIRQEHRVKGL
jgi:hypothetical protein